MNKVVRKSLCLWALLLAPLAFAQSSSSSIDYVLPEVRLSEPGGFNEYEIPQITSTGIAECDLFLTQVEACMKTQIPPQEYADLEKGLNESRLAIMETMDVIDHGQVAQHCIGALEELKREYAPRGCVFN